MAILTFRLITATRFAGMEFLFSITHVIDLRQGRMTCLYRKINKVRKSIQIHKHDHSS